MTRSPIDARLFAQLGSGGFKRIPGQVFTARIPFRGSPELLEYRASTSRRNTPDPLVWVTGNLLETRVGMVIDRLTTSEVIKQVEDFTSNVTEFVAWANSDPEVSERDERVDRRRLASGRQRPLTEESVLLLPQLADNVVFAVSAKPGSPTNRVVLKLAAN